MIIIIRNLEYGNSIYSLDCNNQTTIQICKPHKTIKKIFSPFGLVRLGGNWRGLKFFLAKIE
jgi:hypothetical protein